MTTASDPTPATRLNIAAEDKSAFDRVIDRSSEWFSSILVKESRQALKSRQFLWTFFALLMIVTLWTLGALSYLRSEDGAGMAPGPFLLFGFWMILGFPLAIVIPFATFRSLAHEFEDGTLQLVSITTMKPHQVISGKLGVAVLQIVVYLSVIAPCVAFTYLLRGIDLRQIWWGLLVCVSGSVALCMVGLFLASITRNRQIGIGLSVLFLFGLALVYWIWCVTAYSLTYFFAGSMVGMQSSELTLAMSGYLSLIGSTTFLLFAAASARIAFDADNRSSLIRIAMLVQQILFFGWVLAIVSHAFYAEGAWVISIVQSHYWLFMGAMMCSVPAVMSRRVRRSLPTTVMGRSLKSLFMPGPGRGFLFALCNIWGWNLLVILVFQAAPYLLPNFETAFVGTATTSRSLSPDEHLQIISSISGNCLFATLFLSVVFLVTTVSYRRRPNVGPFFGAALVVVLLAVSSLVPLMIQIQWLREYASDYTLVQVTNWYTTTNELNEYGSSADLAMLSLILIGIAMVVVAGFSLRIAGRELHYLPEAVPNRVLEDERRQRRQIDGAPMESDPKHPLDD